MNWNGRRALLLIAKLLQTMANGEQFTEDKEHYMMTNNRFIRRQKVQWTSFFHKLLVRHSVLLSPIAHSFTCPDWERSHRWKRICGWRFDDPTRRSHFQIES